MIQTFLLNFRLTPSCLSTTTTPCHARNTLTWVTDLSCDIACSMFDLVRTTLQHAIRKKSCNLYCIQVDHNTVGSVPRLHGSPIGPPNRPLRPVLAQSSNPMPGAWCMVHGYVERSTDLRAFAMAARSHICTRTKSFHSARPYLRR